MSPPRPSARTLAAARLRSAICEAGLTQHEAGQLVGVDARQVRRWLSRDVSLGALELLCEIQERSPGSYPVIDARGGNPHRSTGRDSDVGERPRAPRVPRRGAGVTAGETAFPQEETPGAPLKLTNDDSQSNSLHILPGPKGPGSIPLKHAECSIDRLASMSIADAQTGAEERVAGANPAGGSDLKEAA